MKTCFAAPWMILIALGCVSAHAQSASQAEEPFIAGELNPFAASTPERLEKLDQKYQEETGLSPYPEGNGESDAFFLRGKGCYRESCRLFIYVSKSRQRAYLYVDGNIEGQWLVSTGRPGYDTPDFDQHPSGRIYDYYTSTKFPGGDFNDLGNMPYAVFIQGGFALHGTGEGSWRHLGKRASHGCIRMHPDNAYRFNRLVRQIGSRQTWVTVTD